MRQHLTLHARANGHLLQPQAKYEHIFTWLCCLLAAFSTLQTQLIVPMGAILDSSIWHRKEGAPPQQPLPILSPPHCSSPPTLSSSGCTVIGPPPIARLPSPPPVPGVYSPRPPKQVPSALPLSSPPMFKIQATSTGEENSVIEREGGKTSGNKKHSWLKWGGPATLSEKMERIIMGSSSKQWCRRSRSPPAAGSSSNSKPNHIPALVEVYSPTLLLSPVASSYMI
ncbi:hypothetical protein DL96DRAFT_1561991 [Flagelloscypha sp. PMI_526]|nr:hypothetical protein DL96DRAFT_1561991 [Flagelloscypha sp. PMI_526]